MKKTFLKPRMECDFIYNLWFIYNECYTALSDTAPFEALTDYWTQEGYDGPLGTREQTMFRLSAYVDLQGTSGGVS